MRLEGRRALITGGTRGIGRAIVDRFLDEGAQVAFTYRASDDVARAMAEAAGNGERTCRAIRADALDTDAQIAAVGQAIAMLGGIDIIVHNAATAKVPPDAADGLAEYRRQMAINAEAVFAGTLAATDAMAKGGRIIVIGSVGARFMPFPGGAIYGATKAAVVALVRAWARDFGPRGITANVIQPGPIDTDLNPETGPYAPLLRERIALGRYGRPEEIAAVAAFLAGSEASFITGSVIDVDGGFSL